MLLGSINRRRFIERALGAAGALALLKDAHRAILLPGAAELTFFDHRFGRAQELALQLASGGALQSVGGDPTEVALWIQSRTSRGPHRRIQGVTVESVPFCLRQLNPRGELSLQRIDQDLFAWAVSSNG